MKNLIAAFLFLKMSYLILQVFSCLVVIWSLAPGQEVSCRDYTIHTMKYTNITHTIFFSTLCYQHCLTTYFSELIYTSETVYFCEITWRLLCPVNQQQVLKLAVVTTTHKLVNSTEKNLQYEAEARWCSRKFQWDVKTKFLLSQGRRDIPHFLLISLSELKCTESLIN